MWEDKLKECQIRDWIAVSAAGLQGMGLRNSVFSDTGITPFVPSKFDVPFQDLR